MALAFVITGASGFLGQTLLDTARTTWPNVKVYPIHSPQHGGIDLADRLAPQQLAASINGLDPSHAVLIHAAARVAWDSPDGLLANATMAINVATWAQAAQIGFCVLVSGVNVYAPLPLTDARTPCAPTTMYGLGKWAAEQVWQMMLPEQHRAIVRLAGLWGWQRRPTLFWNHLLLASMRDCSGQERPVVHRSQSLRNYLSAYEASTCLLQVGANRMAGLFLGAGRDRVTTGTFVKTLQSLGGSKLSVDWQDDGEVDERLYQPSPELLRWLKPFPEVLAAVWANRPDWVGGRV